MHCFVVQGKAYVSGSPIHVDGHTEIL